MKKNLFIVATLFMAAIASTTFTSCSSDGTNCTLNNDIDSLSYIQGIMLGNNIAPQLSYDPKMDKEQFIKGFKAGLNADSSEYSYRMGEGIGYNIAMSMERDVNIIGVMMEKDILYKAFAAVLNEDSLLFTNSEVNELANKLFEKFMSQKREKEEARFAETPEAKENLAKGEAWLADKAKEEGIVKTESGLCYKVIKEGNGERPNAGSKITMNYKGTLIDGTEFDKGEGASGIVEQFIPGFTEALLLMDEGAIYELYIPANLGYGALVQGNIPSNSVLIFEVELTDIE
ncbi:MAG: FKBP-type peptidyl-prolyl cis-trans isomerase [Bacteroidales bacterium]|nr:FKBP-type peptidyl-prolyl cis-trans isomerase [Bacteroidales bacterium]MBR5532651.1 FKBP-type peptidyl-prolyl cis-trans isomerase [Bacteroidales bacterium]